MNMKLDGASAPRILPELDPQVVARANANALPSAHTSTPQLPYSPHADMAAYRRFLGETLLAFPGVRETRTYAVMEEVKNDGPLPL